MQPMQVFNSLMNPLGVPLTDISVDGLHTETIPLQVGGCLLSIIVKRKDHIRGSLFSHKCYQELNRSTKTKQQTISQQHNGVPLPYP